MNLYRTARLSPRVEWRDETGSTNADLSALLRENPGAWPHLSVLATDTQTAGRGRLGRSWIAPAGASLAASVVLDVVCGARALPPERRGWIPLLAGTAMTLALRAFFDDPERVTLKWPNDVLIDGLKVCGILVEFTDAGIVVGSGVNLSLGVDDLPTPTSTSLLISGARTTDADEVLAAYLGELAPLVSRLATATPQTMESLTDSVSALCSTLGQSVRVELPGNLVETGRALALDDLGRLVVETEKNRQQLVVAAGDVTHLRVIMTHDSSTGDGTHPDRG